MSESREPRRTILWETARLKDSTKLFSRLFEPWKSLKGTIVHAYNTTFHDHTGDSPYFLMFGRFPRLAVDAFSKVSPDVLLATTHTEYMKKFNNKRLHFGYLKASIESQKRVPS